jgi:hypothetical protein
VDPEGHAWTFAQTVKVVAAEGGGGGQAVSGGDAMGKDELAAVYRAFIGCLNAGDWKASAASCMRRGA